MSERGGTFITFEGGEGSGKSTQARLLAQSLRSHGVDVDETREPGGSPFAEHLRRALLDDATPAHSALSEAMVFYAARADHLNARIRPALTAGRCVICDRFSDSTRAYQGYAGDLDLAVLDQLEALVVGGTAPDLTFIVDVEVDVGMARAEVRHGETRGVGSGRDRFEARSKSFHQHLREGFLEIAKQNPGRCVVIDGAQSEAEVARQVLDVAKARLPELVARG